MMGNDGETCVVLVLVFEAGGKGSKGKEEKNELIEHNTF